MHKIMKKITIGLLLFFSSLWGCLISLPVGFWGTGEIFCQIEKCKGNISNIKTDFIPNSFEVLVNKNGQITPILLKEIKNNDNFIIKGNNGLIYSNYEYNVVNNNDSQLEIWKL